MTRVPRTAAVLSAALALAACGKRELKNYRSCLKLRVGMAREKLLETMGGAPDSTEPYVEGKSLPHMKGKTAYEWATPASMVAPIRVVVEERSGVVDSIRCGDSQMTASALPDLPAPSTAAPAGGAPAAPAPADSLFLGHYGWGLRPPAGARETASFLPPDRVVERVEFALPCPAAAPACRAETFAVLVFPWWYLQRLNYAAFDDYVKAFAARQDALEPGPLQPVSAPLRGWAFVRHKPAGPLDVSTVLQGAKVVYAFESAQGSAAAAAAIATLQELKPHDEPPSEATVHPETSGAVRAAGQPIDSGR